MPITYLSKQCPGAKRCGYCSWSTDLLGQPAFIRSKYLLCEICMAIEGLEGSREFLQMQLAGLYMLDTDQFRKARAKMCDRIFAAVGPGVLTALTLAVPTLKRTREEQRSECLSRTLSLLTDGSSLIYCWTKRLMEDTNDLYLCEAAIGHLPVPIRGFIYEFVCSDIWKLYVHLCVVKRRAYHILEQPIFWHPPRDFHEGNNDDPSATTTMLVGVYSYIVEHVHKPKLQSLKHSLVNHTHFIKRNWAMKRHGYRVQKALEIVDSMLDWEIAMVGAIPCDFGPAA